MTKDDEKVSRNRTRRINLLLSQDEFESVLLRAAREGLRVPSLLRKMLGFAV